MPERPVRPRAEHLADNGDELWLELVLSAAEAIPAGRVVSYGDLADIVGVGPRQVGTAMSQHGAAVPWWRVVNASGDPPAQLLAEVRRHWAAEGITVKPNGRGCRINDYRADLQLLADHVAMDRLRLTDRNGTPLPPAGAPAGRALAAAGIRSLDDLATWTIPELLALHGVGPRAVRILQNALVEAGLDYRHP